MARDEARARIAHLYRRAGFGATAAELDAAVGAGYDATVDRLTDLSGPDSGADGLAPPTFGDDPDRPTQRQEGQELSRWWLDRMVVSTVPLRERLTLFWHGHFATSLQKVKEPALMYRQNEIFRTLGAGTFEALAQAVAKDPAMLVWLDANQNRKQSPNENFARELFELFMLGIGNYSETDIREAARAFTGWQYVKAADTFRLVAAQHDTGSKTVFGTTGNLGGEDVIRLANQQPASAPFVAAAVWSHFARPAGPADPVVRDLAAGFARDGNVAGLVRAVFRHPEFVAPATRTGLVKEPIVYVAGVLRALGQRPTATTLQQLNGLGQQPFVPPNVGGWPQNGYWLTTSFALARLRFASAAVQKANLSAVKGAADAARLLGVDEWSAPTAAALAKVADDPKTLVTLALVSPEYVLA